MISQILAYMQAALEEEPTFHNVQQKLNVSLVNKGEPCLYDSLWAKPVADVQWLREVLSVRPGDISEDA